MREIVRKWFDQTLPYSKTYPLLNDMSPREVIRLLRLKYTKSPEAAAKDEVVATMWMALIAGVGSKASTRAEFYREALQALKGTPLAENMLTDLLVACVKDIMLQGPKSQEDADFMFTQAAILLEKGINLA